MSREDNIQKLIDGVLEESPQRDLNDDVYECPFCLASTHYVNVSGLKHRKIPQPPHASDCIWLIAKDLNTGKEK